jgi:hypothetical protein
MGISKSILDKRIEDAYTFLNNIKVTDNKKFLDVICIEK